jgi:hypothetical protein
MGAESLGNLAFLGPPFFHCGGTSTVVVKTGDVACSPSTFPFLVLSPTKNRQNQPSVRRSQKRFSPLLYFPGITGKLSHPLHPELAPLVIVERGNQKVCRNFLSPGV